MSNGANETPLHGIVAFTGRLASMKREEAFAEVRRLGGTPRRGVTKSTDVLVIGEDGWPLLNDGRPSNSLERAKELGVAVVGERRFLEWIGRAVPDDQLKTYSAGQIAVHANLPEAVVEQLSLYGLLDQRDGQYGFRDLAAARHVRELLASGVSPSTISKSLREIRKWLPEAGLTNVKLYPRSQNALLVSQLGGLTDKKGQFVLPVGEPSDGDADLAFEEAQAAEDGGDTAVAERLYRKVLKIDRSDTAAAFNLGNLLRRNGRTVEAEAVYRKLVKSEPDFAEAWYNLSDMLDDQGRLAEAIACLKRALAAAPEYGDAVFNLAGLLQKTDRYADAAEQWRRYLTLDVESEWAVRARRALKFCEMAARASA